MTETPFDPAQRTRLVFRVRLEPPCPAHARRRSDSRPIYVPGTIMWAEAAKFAKLSRQTRHQAVLVGAVQMLTCSRASFMNCMSASLHLSSLELRISPSSSAMRQMNRTSQTQCPACVYSMLVPHRSCYDSLQRSECLTRFLAQPRVCDSSTSLAFCYLLKMFGTTPELQASIRAPGCMLRT